MTVNKLQRHLRRKRRVRAKIGGTKGRPRLSVFRSNNYIYAQLIDDTAGATLAAASDKNLVKKKTDKLTKTQIATLVGEELAEKAKAKKISRVVFDRAGYKYHGRVRALAEGARKGGLKF